MTATRAELEAALADAVRPRLLPRGRRVVRDMIETCLAMGERQDADAFRFLLEQHDKAGAALAALEAHRPPSRRGTP